MIPAVCCIDLLATVLTVPITPAKQFQCKFMLAILLFLLSFPLWANQIHPISVTNTRPTVLIHGLPSSRDPEVAPVGDLNVKLDYEVTSHFSHDKSSTEQVIFDGETRRIALSMSMGMFKGADVSLIVPYITHSGGTLDQFIEDWHDLFGFPQNGRDKSPENRLLYYYQKDGVTKLDFREPESGVGDLQLVFAFKIKHQWLTQQNNLAFKTAIKFPTGESDKLTGSGGKSLSAWLAGDRRTSWWDHDGLTYGSLGAMWLEKGDVITDQQRSFVVFGGIGSGVKFGEFVVLQAQLDAHSPFYEESSFTEISSPTFMLTMGGNVKFNESWNLDIAVTEDILPHSAPDVIFHLGINSHW